MKRAPLEVADIFHAHGDAYRRQYGAATSPEQWRVMHAIEICRTAALGGHVDQCDSCGHQSISYNSCRNRHCPKCQTLDNARWLAARRAELLPVEYYHVVWTLPDMIAPVALQNKRVVYNILFRAVSGALITIAADPRHLGAGIGFTAILHTWGQNLLDHPHLHCVVPGGGLSLDGNDWVACRQGFFLPVKVLSRLFRRLFLEALEKAFKKKQLHFFGTLAHLAHPDAFAEFLASCRNKEWVVYSQPPFGGPVKVLDYLARYTHRIAITNDRLISMSNGRVTFSLKNYRRNGKRETMTLDAVEFIRRFLMHVLPNGFVRIRHYGFLAHRHRQEKLKKCRVFLNVEEKTPLETRSETPIQEQDWDDLVCSLTGSNPLVCPVCRHGRMITIRILFPISIKPLSRAPPGAEVL